MRVSDEFVGKGPNHGINLAFDTAPPLSLSGLADHLDVRCLLQQICGFLNFENIDPRLAETLVTPLNRCRFTQTSAIRAIFQRAR
jgi:hypothetical protein